MEAAPKMSEQQNQPLAWFTKVKQQVFAIALCLPLLAAVFFSTRPAFLALIGVALFDTSPFVNYNWDNPSSALTGRRLVQRHFTKVGLHIPLENIVATSDDSSTNPRTVDLMVDVCGKGVLLIWVPLRLKLPFIGDWVTEWCWVPKIKKVKK